MATIAAAADDYSPRERRFIAASAILGYVYNLIIMTFLLTQIQTSLGPITWRGGTWKCSPAR